MAAGKDRLVDFSSLDLTLVIGAEVSTWHVDLGSYDWECLGWTSAISSQLLDPKERSSEGSKSKGP